MHCTEVSVLLLRLRQEIGLVEVRFDPLAEPAHTRNLRVWGFIGQEELGRLVEGWEAFGREGDGLFMLLHGELSCHLYRYEKVERYQTGGKLVG